MQVIFKNTMNIVVGDVIIAGQPGGIMGYFAGFPIVNIQALAPVSDPDQFIFININGSNYVAGQIDRLGRIAFPVKVEIRPFKVGFV